jgi:hypothetical protein
MLSKFWKIWKYALGSFNDETTKRYDDIICIIRSFIFIQLVITNCFIIAGNIRHWNDNVPTERLPIQHQPIKEKHIS